MTVVGTCLTPGFFAWKLSFHNEQLPVFEKRGCVKKLQKIWKQKKAVAEEVAWCNGYHLCLLLRKSAVKIPPEEKLFIRIFHLSVFQSQTLKWIFSYFRFNGDMTSSSVRKMKILEQPNPTVVSVPLGVQTKRRPISL